MLFLLTTQIIIPLILYGVIPVIVHFSKKFQRDPNVNIGGLFPGWHTITVPPVAMCIGILIGYLCPVIIGAFLWMNLYDTKNHEFR